MKFVHDHHQKVRRVALAVDGCLPAMLSKLAGHFVEAEIRVFGYGEEKEAKAWVRE
jgi:hypothetical protein